MIDHLTPVRMAFIKKTSEGGEITTTLHSWWECKTVQSLWKKARRFSKK